MDSDSDGGVVFDEDLVRDMSTMGKDEFMHYYSTRYQYLYRTCRQDWTGLYQLTDDVAEGADVIPVFVVG